MLVDRRGRLFYARNERSGWAAYVVERSTRVADVYTLSADALTERHIATVRESVDGSLSVEHPDRGSPAARPPGGDDEVRR